MSLGFKGLRICFAAVALSVAPVLLPTSQVHAQSGQPDRQYLIGHWMHESVDLEEPVAEHIVFNPNGTYRSWTDRPGWKSQVENGRWRVAEKFVFLQTGQEQEISIPIYVHKGQLILPNIPNRRQGWDKVSN